MNSKDLMYGNLLYYDNTQIAVDHNVINRIGSGEPHFKPIPISDHRLRFNGFHPDGKIYEMKFGFQVLALVEQKDCYLAKVTDQTTRSTVSLRTIEYWHELQNLVKIVFNFDL